MKQLPLLLLLVFCSLLAEKSQAQVTLTGTIVDKENGLVLPYASITNKTTGRRAYSDKGGFYKISAKKGDMVVFGFLGYNPDSLVVKAESGVETREVHLVVESRQLHGVEVSTKFTPYQLDSINRRDQFGYILDNPDKPLAGGSTPVGAGIVFSPFTRYSRKEKQKREFKKIYAKAEKDKYIDSRFTPLFVSRVTSLKGDSLRLFMGQNYPDYDTLRMMPTEDLMYWITDKYKAWKKK
ncbi:carboxypeptidase-like regulatory domain-containing protein [Chitinophaga sancti]|uniref:CarboxypepD_reg-like domain-containing protein n=1 Tax=Chitinophaga sancti TaxID=1004 RepID=A0A1K1PU46_9BACT|nr:carboxypeptidase-like regulatory domain-containing protein [Chitinophaga sancti]WQD61632.1 carboxypeptidase-like regulatory domain-containing protein [Chitinophaga sancti]WQG92811.1 carboxypeptidase-like regulatory domain-containing protein [Chitinophaga sancti]SFW51127.1 CarboxypepD_reg-like domain-containing protein [Chitinophaga sancti]